MAWYDFMRWPHTDWEAQAQASAPEGWEETTEQEMRVMEPLLGVPFTAKDGSTWVFRNDGTPKYPNYKAVNTTTGAVMPARLFLAQEGEDFTQYAPSGEVEAQTQGEAPETQGVETTGEKDPVQELVDSILGSEGGYSTSSDWGEQQAAFYNRELDELLKQRQFENYMNWAKFQSETARDPLDWITSAFLTRGVEVPGWVRPEVMGEWMGATPFPWYEKDQGEDVPIQPWGKEETPEAPSVAGGTPMASQVNTPSWSRGSGGSWAGVPWNVGVTPPESTVKRRPQGAGYGATAMFRR